MGQKNRHDSRKRLPAVRPTLSRKSFAIDRIHTLMLGSRQFGGQPLKSQRRQDLLGKRRGELVPGDRFLYQVEDAGKCRCVLRSRQQQTAVLQQRSFAAALSAAHQLHFTGDQVAPCAALKAEELRVRNRSLMQFRWATDLTESPNRGRVHGPNQRFCIGPPTRLDGIANA